MNADTNQYKVITCRMIFSGIDSILLFTIKIIAYEFMECVSEA